MFQCELCGKHTVCYLTYEDHDKRPQPKKKRSKYIYKSVRLTKKEHKELAKEAKRVGCSMMSLILNYIDAGLHPKAVTVMPSYEVTRRQTATITREQTVRSSGPVGYQAPSYFNELKEVLEKRKNKRRNTP